MRKQRPRLRLRKNESLEAFEIRKLFTLLDTAREKGIEKLVDNADVRERQRWAVQLEEDIELLESLLQGLGRAQ